MTQPTPNVPDPNSNGAQLPPRLKFLGLDDRAWVYIGLGALLAGEAMGFVYRGMHPELTYGQWQQTGAYTLSYIVQFAGLGLFGIGLVLRWRRVAKLPAAQRAAVSKRAKIVVPVVVVLMVLPLVWFLVASSK